jgi:hypothetical protein
MVWFGMVKNKKAVGHSKTGLIRPVFKCFGCHFAFEDRTQKAFGK